MDITIDDGSSNLCPFFFLFVVRADGIKQVGYRRTLERNDIWTVNPDRSTHLLAPRLKAAFQDECKKGTDRPLLVAMFRTFKTDLVIGGAAAFLAQLTQIFIPFVVKYIINYAARAYYAQQRGLPAPNVGEGVGLVLCITVMQIFGSMGNNVSTRYLYK